MLSGVADIAGAYAAAGGLRPARGGPAGTTKDGVRLRLEPMEPRLLLSADVLALDLAATAGNADQSIVVRVVDEAQSSAPGAATVERVVVVDRNSGGVLARRDLDAVSGVRIQTGGGDDRLSLDLGDDAGRLPDIDVRLGAGNDTLALERATAPDIAAVWTVEDDGVGRVATDVGAGGAVAQFHGAENLEGADTGADTFVIRPGGGLSGGVDGGSAGVDTLLQSRPGGASVTATGIETSEDVTVTDDLTIQLDGDADVLTLGLDGVGLPRLSAVSGDHAGASFVAPGDALTIGLGGGDDTLTVEALPEDARFELSIFGDDGGRTSIDAEGAASVEEDLATDSVVIAGDVTLGGGDLYVGADEIEIASGATVDTRARDAGGTAGASGGVAMVGREISLANGAAILAGVDETSPFAAGDVRLAAVSRPDDALFTFEAAVSPAAVSHREARVDIGDARIAGADVDISVDSTVILAWDDLPDLGEAFVDNLTGVVSQLPDLLTSALTGVAAQVATYSADATAALTDAEIVADGDVSVTAAAESVLSYAATAINSIAAPSPVLLSTVIGYGAPDARVTLAGATRIDAEGSVELLSDVNAETDTGARTIGNSLASAPSANDIEMAASVAVAVSDVDSHVAVGAGSLVHSAAGNVAVHATAGERGDQISTGSSAEVQIFQDGIGGATVAVSVGYADVTTTVDGTILADSPSAATDAHAVDPGTAVDFGADTIDVPVPRGRLLSVGDALTLQDKSGDGTSTAIDGLAFGEEYVVADVETVGAGPTGFVTQRIKLARGTGETVSIGAASHASTHSLTSIETLTFTPAAVSEVQTGPQAGRLQIDLAGVSDGDVLTYAGPAQSVELLLPEVSFEAGTRGGPDIIRLPDAEEIGFDRRGLFVGQDIRVTGTGLNDGDYAIGGFGNGGRSLLLTSTGSVADQAATPVGIVSLPEGQEEIRANIEGTVQKDTALVAFEAANATAGTPARIVLEPADAGDPQTWFDLDMSFPPGAAFTVANSTSNDGDYVVDRIVDGGRALVLAGSPGLTDESARNVELSAIRGGVTFASDPGANDRITIEPGATSDGPALWSSYGIRIGDRIDVSGSTNNDGTFDVAGVDDNGRTLLVDGDVLTDERAADKISVAVAAAGGPAPVGGLTIGEDYRASISNGLVQLTSDATGSRVSFSGTGRGIQGFALADRVVTFAPDAGNIDDARGVFTIHGHGFDDGDVVVYERDRTTTETVTDPVTGNPIDILTPEVDGLDSGQAYYVVKLDDDTFRLANSAHAAAKAEVIDLGAGGGAGAGMQALVAPLSFTGVSVQSRLVAKNTANAGVSLSDGAQDLASVGATFTQPETLLAILNVLRGTARDAAPAPGGDDGLPVDVALTFAINIVDHEVCATVGSTATIKTPGDVTVDASVTQSAQMASSAEATRAAIDDFAVIYPSTDIRPDTEVAVGVALGLYDNTARAHVADGAVIDAGGVLRVDGSVGYPLLDYANVVDPRETADDGGLMALSFIQSGDLGLSSGLFNATVTALAGAPRQPDADDVAIGAGVAVTRMTNRAEATVAGGAAINQDDAYRSDAQAVEIEAATDVSYVEVAQNSSLNLTLTDTYGQIDDVRNPPENRPALSNSAQLRRFLGSYVNPIGSGAKTAVGPAILVNVTDNRTRSGILDSAPLAISPAPSAGDTLYVDGAEALRTGSPVVYAAPEGAAPVQGLVSGGTYYAIVDPADPGRIRLAASESAAAAGSALTVGASALATRGHTLTPLTRVTVGAQPTEAGVAGLSVGASQAGLSVAVAQTGAKSSEVGVSISAVAGVLDHDTEALIGRGAVVEGGPVAVDGRDTASRYGIAGGVLLGRHVGVGVSVAVNVTERDVVARIGGPGGPGAGRVDAAGAVDVTASLEGAMLALSLGGALQGSAPVTPGTQVSTSPSGSPTMTELPVISLALTASVTVETNDVTAAIRGADLSADAVTVDATSDVATNGVAVAAAFAVDVGGSIDLRTRSSGLSIAGAGAVTVNDKDQTTRAEIADSGVTARRGGLSVTAADASSVEAIAGTLAVAAQLQSLASTRPPRTVAVGVSVGVNDISGSVDARILGSGVRAAGDVAVRADNATSIYSLTFAGALAASGGAAGSSASSTLSLAAAGAGSGNFIGMDARAAIAGGVDHDGDGADIASATGAVTVKAEDTSSVTGDSGGVAIAVAAQGIGRSVAPSVGISAVKNEISNATAARVVDASVKTESATEGEIEIDALSRASISALSVGGAAGTLAFTGAGSGNYLTRRTTATARNATLAAAGGRIGVTARAPGRGDGEASIEALTGGVALGFSLNLGAGSTTPVAGFGVSVSLNRVADDVRATVDGGKLETLGAGAGVVVAASADSVIESTAFAGAGAIGISVATRSFSVAGTGTGARNDIAGTIEARVIGGADIDSASAIEVTADDTSTIDSTAAAVAIDVSVGTNAVALAIGATVADNSIADTVLARVGGASTMLDSPGEIRVAATADNDVDAVTVAAGVSVGFSISGRALGGAVGVVVSDNEIAGTIAASVEDGAALTTTGGGAIVIGAVDGSDVDATNVDVSVTLQIAADRLGAGASVGLAITENDIDNAISATASGATLTSDGAITVSATENADIEATSVSVVASAGVNLSQQGTAVAVAVGGAISDNRIAGSVEAALKEGTTASTGNGGTLSVRAENTATLVAENVDVAVSAAISLSGSAFSANAAFSASTNTVETAVSALIEGDGPVDPNDPDIDSAGAVTVAAVEDADLTADAVGVSVSVGIGQGVSVAFALIVAENSVSGDAEARIGGVGVEAVGDVTVSASSEGTLDAAGTAVSVSVSASFGSDSKANISGAIGAVGLDNRVASRVDAEIADGAVVTTTDGGDVTVCATNDSDLAADGVSVSVAVTFSLSSGSINGSVAFGGVFLDNVIAGEVAASVAGGAHIDAAGDVDITALSVAGANATATGVSVSVTVNNPKDSFGFSLAGGATIVRNLMEARISATAIDGADIDADRDVVIRAADHAASGDNDETTLVADATTVSVSLAAGLSLGIAAGVTENVHNATIAARVADSEVEAGLGDSGGDVTVEAGQHATARAELTVASVGLAVGAGGRAENVVGAIPTALEDLYADQIGSASQGGSNPASGAQTWEWVSDLYGGVEPGSVTAEIAGLSSVVAEAGEVRVGALSALSSKVDFGGGAGGLVGVTAAIVKSSISVPVTAVIGGGASVTGQDVTVAEDATHRSETKFVAGSVGVVAGAGGKSISSIDSGVTARIGDGATLKVGQGRLSVEADTDAETRAFAEGGAGGGIVISYFEAGASYDGSTVAEIGDDVTLRGIGQVEPGGVMVDAHADINGFSDILAVGIGVSSIIFTPTGIAREVEDADDPGDIDLFGTSSATVSLLGGVDARIGDNADMDPVAGSVTVMAEALVEGRGEATAGGGSALDLAFSDFTTEILASEGRDHFTMASIGSGGTITAGDIGVEARQTETAYARDTVGQGGLLLAGGLAGAETRVDGGAMAWIGAEGGTRGDYTATDGNIEVRTNTVSYGNAVSRVASGAGLAAGRDSNAKTLVNTVQEIAPGPDGALPPPETTGTLTEVAVLGNTRLQASGDVIVRAAGAAEGDARSTSYGGAILGNGYSADGTVVVGHSVETQIGESATLNADGNVRIEAIGQTEQVEPADPAITAVDGVADTLVMLETLGRLGLETGDSVTVFKGGYADGDPVFFGEPVDGSPEEVGKDRNTTRDLPYRIFDVLADFTATGVVDVIGGSNGGFGGLRRGDGASWRSLGFQEGDRVIVGFPDHAGSDVVPTGRYSIDAIEDGAARGDVLRLEGFDPAAGASLATGENARVTADTSNRLRLGQKFGPENIDPRRDVIDFKTAHNLSTFDQVRILPTDESGMAAVADVSGTYYVEKVSETEIRLFDDREDIPALTGSAFTQVLDTLENVSIRADFVVDQADRKLTFADPSTEDLLELGYAPGDLVKIEMLLPPTESLTGLYTIDEVTADSVTLTPAKLESGSPAPGAGRDDWSSVADDVSLKLANRYLKNARFNGQFDDGREITYFAPDQQTFSASDVNVRLAGGTYDPATNPNPIEPDPGSNTIFLPSSEELENPGDLFDVIFAGLQDGDRVTYDVGLGQALQDIGLNKDDVAIGGLEPGHAYYVQRLPDDPYRIQLRLTPDDPDDDTDDNDVVTLTPPTVPTSQTGPLTPEELGVYATHILRKAELLPPVGLEDAGRYVVAKSDGATFRIAPADAPNDIIRTLRIDGANMVRRDLGERTEFRVSAVDLQQRHGQLYLDLAGTPDIHKDLFGAATLGEIVNGSEPAEGAFKLPVGLNAHFGLDGTSFARAQGGGGTIGVEVDLPSATTDVSSNVRVTIADRAAADALADIDAGGDVVITASSAVDADAKARSDSGGLIQGARAQARTHINANDANVSVGDDTIVRGASVSVLSATDNTLDVNAIGKGGGVVAVSIVESSARTATHATMTIGAGAVVEAQGHVSLHTDIASRLVQKSQAEVWGAAGVLVAEANNTAYPSASGFPRTLEYDGKSNIVIEPQARIEGRTVSIDARVSQLDVEQGNFARAIMTVLVGSASAFVHSDTDIESSTLVEIIDGGAAPGTVIRGTRGVDIVARHEEFVTRRIAGRLAVALIPAQSAKAKGTGWMKDVVKVAPGATVYAGPRAEDTPLLTAEDFESGSLSDAETDPVFIDALPFEKMALFVEAGGVGIKTRKVSGVIDDGVTDLDAYQDQNKAQETIRDNVEWYGDVVISAGPSPRLVVNEQGNIDVARNVTVDGIFEPGVGDAADVDGVDGIQVGDIYNDGDTGNVAMVATLGDVRGGTVVDAPDRPPKYWGTFTFNETFQSVEIVNRSTEDLHIGNINLADSAGGGESGLRPKVDLIDAAGFIGAAPLDFDIRGGAQPARLTIENISGSGLYLDGTGIIADPRTGDPLFPNSAAIENPLGDTRIYNRGGNILAPVAGDPGVPKIRTNRLYIAADSGTVGTSAARVTVDLVILPGAAESLEARAGADLWLDLGARLVQQPGVTQAEVDVALLEAGGTVDVTLRETVRDTGKQVAGAVQARNLRFLQTPPQLQGAPVIPGYDPYDTFYRPDDQSIIATPRDGGLVPAGGAGTGTVDSLYVVDLAQAGESVISASDVDIRSTISDPDTGSIALEARTDVIGEGHVDIDVTGAVVVTETVGDMRLGQVRSRGGKVTLTSQQSILDAAAGDPLSPTAGDEASDVTAVGIDLVATGGIGTAPNPVDIDSSNRDAVRQSGQLDASAGGDVFIREVDGDTGASDDLRLGLVTSSAADVTLIADDGRILDGRERADTLLANISATDVNLITRAWGETTVTGVGTTGNFVEIDSGANGSPGRLVAVATLDGASGSPQRPAPATGIFVEEVAGALAVLTVDSPNGNATLRVRESAAADEDFVLVPSGTDYTGDPVANATVNASGTVLVQAGDGVTTRDTSAVTAGDAIRVHGDHGNADADGTVMDLRGSFAAPAITVFGHADDDLITFDRTYLGGETVAYGSQSASPGRVAGDAPLADDGADRFVVDRLATMPGGADGPTLSLDGQSDTDAYLVRTNGSASLASDYVINVVDTGASDDGLDTLTIEGTGDDDVFLLRRHDAPSSVNTAAGMVALLHGTLGEALANGTARADTVERINYSENVNARLMVLGLGGDDYFASDDNLAITTLDGGAGSDRFQIGQVFGTARSGSEGTLWAGIRPDSQFTTTLTTRGWLSRGASFALTALGGSGADSFTVFSTGAPLRLEGNAGNDTITVRAFRLVDPATRTLIENASSANEITKILGGLGDDNILYNVNAPVSIDGGEGFDSVVVLGTEAADVFTITEDAIRGGGLSVSLSGSEEYFEVDGLEGDDTFYILSTSADVATQVFGGLGSDRFSVAGDVDRDVVSLDPDGRGGLVTHAVDTGTTGRDTGYDGVFVPPVSYTVADDRQGQVVVDEADGPLVVDEADPAGSVAVYDLFLAAAPAGVPVFVTVSAARPTAEEERGAPPGDGILVSTDGVNFDRYAGLTFTAGGSANTRRIWVKAVDDALSEGERTVVISHSVASADPAFDEALVPDVEVTVRDNDRDGLVLTETDGRTLVLSGNLDASAGDVTGIADSYRLRPTRAPAAGETVTATLTFDPQSIELASADPRFGPVVVDASDPTVARVAVTFDATDWDRPVEVTITANDRKPVDTSILHTLAGSAPGFGTIVADRLEVDVYSRSEAAVLVQESGGGTHLVESGEGDGYTLRLTKAPTGDRTVSVRLFDDGQAALSSADPRFDAATQTVTFDSSNWYQPVEVTMTAVAGDPSGQPTLPTTPTLHTLAGIRGPLLIEGGISGEDRLIGRALVLPGETNPPAFEITGTADETRQVDRVDVYNDDSTGRASEGGERVDRGELGLVEQAVPAADGTVATREVTHLSGLGMSEDPLSLNVGSFENPELVSVAAGISYGGVEILELMLGRATDRLLISETLSTDAAHGGATIVHGGGGDDEITVTRRDDGSGRTDTLVVYGDTSQDGARYGNEASGADASTLAHVFANPGDDVIDASGSDRTLAIYGGRGDDAITGSRAGDHLAGGSGGDTIDGEAGDDHVYGDSGLNFAPDDRSTTVEGEPGLRILTVPTVSTSSLIASDDLTAGGDTLAGGAGRDILFGDHGRIDQTAAALRILTTTGVTEAVSVVPRNGAGDRVDGGGDNDLVIGGAGPDILAGGTGNDLLFGDHGRVEATAATVIDLSRLPLSTLAPDFPFTFASIFATLAPAAAGDNDDLIHGDGLPGQSVTGPDGDDIILGQQGADRAYGGGGDDDLIGGHNVAGGLDTGDSLDGEAGDDVIAGDNASIARRGDALSPRFRALAQTAIYDTAGRALVTGDSQLDPTGTQARTIVLFDQAAGTSASVYGDDYLAGGTEDDVIFGQLGDDTIQGDGGIGPVEAPTAAGAFVDADGRLAVSASVATGADGDDYIEGNGGSDVAFGNLGQDDIVGGSSTFFAGLGDTDRRRDGRDILFGGAGTPDTLARNALGAGAVLGDADGRGHAYDADVILGDNGNIYRLIGVQGTPGDGGVPGISTFAGFLAFNYDSYTDGLPPARQLKIIPRAVDLVDYARGGSPGDMGGNDIIHGEDSDDRIYGAAGNDVLYGDGYDDDIYGGIGRDRILGGSGEDGILGDDGILRTSRNGTIEPLNRLAAADTQKLIETRDPFIGAVVDITGILKKNVDLLAREQGGDDVIYGGLGDDWIHAGIGDDAVSGAEALESADPLLDFYHRVTSLGETPPIVYNPLNGKLESFNLLDAAGRVAYSATAYDADSPREKIVNFFLNFDTFDASGTLIEDGKDRIFGDLGNDWLVGGTGHDRLFGGMGDDYLQMDDNLETTGTDDARIPAVTGGGADFAFGGGGRDVLISNTGYDNGFDWVGEFNTYIVPFSQFGPGSANRRPTPDTVRFLQELGAAAGMDASLVEPNGELGLVLQKDPAWSDQSGAPRDPQPGNGDDVIDIDRGDRTGRKEDDSNRLLTVHGSTPTGLAGGGEVPEPFVYDLVVEKAANAADPLAPTTREDADLAPGQEFRSGEAVVWTYLASNPGTSTGSLSDLVVIDDAGTRGIPATTSGRPAF